MHAPKGIRLLDGSTTCLVAAPHGPVINNEYLNDIRTGVIAQVLHQDLGYRAVINDRFFKPKGSIMKSQENGFRDSMTAAMNTARII